MTGPGREYQCEAIINIDPPVRATGSIITLDVAGTWVECAIFDAKHAYVVNNNII